jgi:CheY-like chemotaxis protein/HPt (histidine-containing phosphotransfer) domain-containing protein
VSESKPRAAERRSAEGVRGRRVLVVDDHATSRLILEEMLRRWGVEAAPAASAAAALAVLADARQTGRAFDLVIADGQILDDADIARRIVEAEPARPTPVVLLGSQEYLSDDGDEAPAHRAARLLKPVKASELLDAIARTLGSAETAAPSPAAACPADRRLRILLAEDSVVNQRLAVALLEKRGHSVVVAGSGEEAVEAVARQPVDLVLMDLEMPGMTGLEATAIIRQAEHAAGGHMPIIAMTAHAIRGDRERCLAGGMDGYVSKPIRVHELFEAIDRAASPRRDSAAAEGETSISAAPAAGDSGVDWEAALRSVSGDEELLLAVVETAAEELPKQLRTLREAAARGDATLLRIAAHTLKGTIRYFGVPRAVEQACQLEDLAAAGSTAGADDLLALLEEQLRRLEAEFSEYRRVRRAAAALVSCGRVAR